MRSATRRAALALVAGGLTVASLTWVLSAQSSKAQDPQQPPPRFRTEANFVRVDVYPLKDGKPLLGLTADDFEVFEDNVPQKVETFEHIVVRPTNAAERIDPGSQRASLQAAANPRNRVFVIFLDTPHVSVTSAHQINEPLIRLLDRILSPDDLVGIMTPAMAASQVVLGRKTQVIEDSLRKNWAWGDRFTLNNDERERAYEACYPPLSTEKGRMSSLAHELIERKRERATLEAMQDLVRYLRSIREERKAILAVTEGWLLYGENPNLMKLREDPQVRWKEPVPTVDPIAVGPNGKLTTKDPRDPEGTLTKSACDSDRMRLAMMDNKRFFRDLMEEANYGNASFYPIDPRGLAVFDGPLGPDAPHPISVDMAILRERLDSMRTLAENTDGLALVSSNALDKGLQTIADDLTSYYLLGYYSTNGKLDGRFRSLKVKVKRPGVDVRARRGYRAASEAEVTAARKAADAPVADSTRAVMAAIGKLDGMRSNSRFRVNGSVYAGAKPALWVAGELESSGGRPDVFSEGATADIEALFGSVSTTARVVLKSGERTFLAAVPMPPGATGGDVEIRARLTPVDGPSAALSDTVRFQIAPSAPMPLFFRRGPTTGNKLLPAADLRFSRTDRVRVDLPVGDDVTPGSGRLLDRAGQPLQVPVTVSERTDADSGQRWITADVVLGPLAQGDFAIEIGLSGATAQKVVTAIRVVR